MDGSYDVIVLGTGMTECVLSGLLSVEGKKVLHMDRNNFYGGDCASLNLEQLYTQFYPGKEAPKDFGRCHDFNVDLCPKLLLAAGNLVKVLHKTVAERYSMRFTLIDGSYVMHKKKIYKVPATPKEALSSSLLGFFEKPRVVKFLSYVQDYELKDPKTHGKKDLTKMTFAELVKDYSLSENTVQFLGCCVALELDDSFMGRPAIETVLKLQLYAYSQSMHGSSPFVYPLYGLGDIPQAFARLCAVHAGTYMLDKPDVEVILSPEGKFTGVKSAGETATAPILICDPRYLPSKAKKTGEVVRVIALLDHPIPGVLDGTTSCQIIIPAKEVGRKSDIYIVQVSSIHQVVPKGFYLAIVSAAREVADIEANVAPGVALLGTIKERFTKTYENFEPTADGKGDGCFVTKTLDATSHFESCCDDVMEVYKRVTGKDLDPDAIVVPDCDGMVRHAAPPAAVPAEAAGAGGGEAAAEDPEVKAFQEAMAKAELEGPGAGGDAAAEGTAPPPA